MIGWSSMRNMGAWSCLLLFLAVAGMVAFPETASAAEEDGAWGVWLELGRLFNLALVIGILIWATRKPLGNFFSGRTRKIRQQLEEALKARKDAEAKLAEMEARMSRLDDELREIRHSAEVEAGLEYRRLVEAAEIEAEKTLERARAEIEGMTRTARQELKKQAAELAVKLAEESIREEISDADQERLLARFVDELGGKP